MNVGQQSTTYPVICTIEEELSNLEDLSELQMGHSKCLILENIIILEEGPKGGKTQLKTIRLSCYDALLARLFHSQ